MQPLFVGLANARMRSKQRGQDEADAEIRRNALAESLEHTRWERQNATETAERQKAREIVAQRQAEEQARRRRALLQARGVPAEQHDAIADDDDVFRAYAKPTEPDDVNWQTVEGADGFAQVNPRTGQTRPIQGVRPKPPVPSGGTGDRGVVATQRLGERYDRDPTIKSASDVSTSAAGLRAAAAENSPAGDLAFIFGYMRLLDPSSTVREGEFAQVEASRSAPGWLKGMARKAESGQRLSVAEKQRYLSAATAIANSRRPGVAAVQKRYGALARQTGADSSLVAPDPFEGLGGNAPTPQTKGPQLPPLSPADKARARTDAGFRRFLVDKGYSL